MTAAINIRIEENKLTDAVKAQMWEVYQAYYHYSHESFLEKMAKSTHYAFYYAGEQLVGFTGLRINRMEVNGQKRLFMYFGQTVVERAYRGRNLIQITGMKLIAKYAKDIIFGHAYYWCDALTYRAYLVFAKSLQEFYPSPRQAASETTLELMNSMGNMHYGKTYDPQTGTIRKDVKFVNDKSVEARTQDLNDEDVNFYVQANPGYVRGNGLLVMAPINVKNVWHLVKRFFKKRAQARAKVAVAIRPQLSLLN